MLFDALAIRVDGPRAWAERLTIDVRLTDTGARFRLLLANGVLTYSPAEKPDAADATLRLPSTSLPVLVSGAVDARRAGRGRRRARGRRCPRSAG